jgi:hypothetical protein
LLDVRFWNVETELVQNEPPDCREVASR